MEKINFNKKDIFVLRFYYKYVKNIINDKTIEDFVKYMEK